MRFNTFTATVSIVACTVAPDGPMRSSDLVDLVPPTSSEQDLVTRVGSGEVERAEIQLGEGETEPGTILFPGDGVRRAEVRWRDPGTRDRPEWVRISGTESVWMVGPGITLGMALDSLETLNGRPFELYGFGWDYGGTVVSWAGGELEALGTSEVSVLVRLGGPAAEQVGDVDEVMGERVFSTAHPAMQRLNPRIHEIVVRYEH